MQGEIVIGTKLETDDFEVALQNLVQKAEQAGRKVDTGELRKALTNVAKDAEDKMKVIEPLAEKFGELMEEYLSLTSKSKGTLIFESDKKEAEELKTQLEGIVKEIEKITGEKISIAGITDLKDELPKVQSGLDNVGKATQNIIRKIVKWGLALIGIRGLYGLITGSISTLSQYDDQLATDIQYIRYLIANTLKPVIDTIINAVYTLLAYVNYLAKAWFNVDLFASASLKEFQKQNKSLKNSTKQAKELGKTIAGFDEMNILQDNKTSSGSGGSKPEEIKTPKYADLDKIKIPKWLEWIKNNAKPIAIGLGLIAGALTAIKLGFTALQSLGIGIAIAGIVYTIEKIIDYMNDPTWENFMDILIGISVVVLGLAIAFGSLPLAIGALIAGVVLVIVKNFDKIKQLFTNLIEFLDTKFLKQIRNLFGPLGDLLYAPIKFFVETAIGAFDGFYGGIKTVIEGIMFIFQGDFLGGIKKIFSGLLSIMTAPFRGLITAVGSTCKQIAQSFNFWFGQIKEKVGIVINSVVGIITGIWSKVSGSFSTLKNKISGVFDDIKDFFMKPINNFIEAIKGLWGKIKGTIEDVAKKIGDALNPTKIVDNIKNGAKNIVSGGAKKIKNFFGFAKGGIVLPKLASGGIINQPGRGVPLASAIAGERGAEGVIPLTDSQQMALLGEAIGKYITITANITNSMNGRVISREIQRINAEQDFAYNR